MVLEYILVQKLMVEASYHTGRECSDSMVIVREYVRVEVNSDAEKHIDLMMKYFVNEDRCDNTPDHHG